MQVVLHPRLTPQTLDATVRVLSRYGTVTVLSRDPAAMVLNLAVERELDQDLSQLVAVREVLLTS